MNFFEKEVDIVIIGSGAGGGTVAKELAPLCKEGVRIAVLEWGPRFRDEEFTGRELEMVNKLYFNGGGYLTKNKTVTLAFAKAYGGTSVVFTGVSTIPPRETVEKWNVPGIFWEDLRSRSEKYLKENNVHLLEEEKINETNKLFFEACRKLNYRVVKAPVALKGCRGSGLCNLGCPNQAKQGTNRVQLPIAEKNGVAVVTGCRVERIEDRTLLATVITPEWGTPSPWEPGNYRIKAKCIVVAAGAVNSSALLLRSGLGKRAPMLGRYFTCHPAIAALAEHSRKITNHWGHPQSYYCDEFSASHRFLLQSIMYPPFVTAKNLSGFGKEHSQLMKKFDRLQLILAIALDQARYENRVLIDRKGDPIVDYRLQRETLNSLLEAMKVSGKILFEAGAVRAHIPGSSKFLIEPSDATRLDDLIVSNEFKPGKISVSAAHLMGGCRMGSDLSDSVTNSWGQFHGIPWLFVADASLFPQCAEIYPYITIMALADRVAEYIRKNSRDLLH